MGYHLPSPTDWVTSSWQDHKNRNPPSVQPGTDYGSSYGSKLYAVGNGVITAVDTNPAGGEGRFLTLSLDDGRDTNSLHLDTISVSKGQRVTKGQVIGKTGASGYGSDWGYGAHVHQTLWPHDAWDDPTIDFAKYVDGQTIGKTQREAGPEGVNGREDPNTNKPPTQFLEPGVVGDFDGWIYGESVDGNKTWFRGEHSGDFFWSGGFTDKGTHDLKNLNPTTPGTRTALSTASANRRNDPSTKNPPTGELAAGASTVMDGWITGESVDGNAMWYREKSSQDFYWSGGFTSQSKTDLIDLNTPAPPNTSRTVLATADANIRALPYTASPATDASDPNEVVPMNGWTHGEAVSGNDVWFRRAADSKWSWSGGFTSQATTGLTEVVPPPSPPTPADPDNPRGLKEYVPIYLGAFQGLEAPLGFTDCKNPTTRTKRDKAGSDQHPVTPIIDTYIIHWTATMTDQMDYFSYCNSRSVCPSFYMRRDGSVSEMIRPSAKPAATGSDWNWRSLATETLAAPGSDFTEAQWEAHAQIIAWIAGYNGSTLDGVPVDFTIDRAHVKGHRECLPGATDCPGDAQIAGLDALLTRAQEIYDAAHPPGPSPDIDYDRIAKVVNDEAARRREGWT